MEQSYEDAAFGFLQEFTGGDSKLVEGWRSNSDKRWLLTLQLCKSYHDEIEKARKR